MSQWDIFRKTMLIRAKMQPLTHRVHQAQDAIRRFLAQCATPYVAVSGGKDSAVALDLVRSVDPSVPVVWSDEEWILPGTVEAIDALEAHYDAKVWRLRERYGAKHFFKEFGVWPASVKARPVDYEAETWGEVMAHFGYTGVVLGLRRDESAGRRLGLYADVYQLAKNGFWKCVPLRRWKTEDVWAYIFSRELPYHSAYEAMINAGVHPDYARVGPLTAAHVYQYGMLSQIRRLWPDAWREFSEANPCVEREA